MVGLFAFQHSAPFLLPPPARIRGLAHFARLRLGSFTPEHSLHGCGERRPSVSQRIERGQGGNLTEGHMARLRTLQPRLQTLGSRLATMAPGSWRTDKQTSTQRGYGYRWQKRREAQLRAQPLCRYCERKGMLTPASVADHITPHRGDEALFNGPLQSLCATCHSSDKAKEEARGRMDSLGPSRV
jgi:5-methylcytosine-specific restriction protein A